MFDHNSHNSFTPPPRIVILRFPITCMQGELPAFGVLYPKNPTARDKVRYRPHHTETEPFAKPVAKRTTKTRPQPKHNLIHQITLIILSDGARLHLDPLLVHDFALRVILPLSFLYLIYAFALYENVLSTGSLGGICWPVAAVRPAGTAFNVRFPCP